MNAVNSSLHQLFRLLNAIILLGLLASCGSDQVRSTGSATNTTTPLSAPQMARRVTAYVSPSTPYERLESVVKGLEMEAKSLRGAGLNGMSVDQENSSVTFNFGETTSDKVREVLSMLKAQLQVVCVIEEPGGELVFGSERSLQERRADGDRCAPEVSE